MFQGFRVARLQLTLTTSRSASALLSSHFSRFRYVAARVVSDTIECSADTARPTKYTTLERTRKAIRAGSASHSSALKSGSASLDVDCTRYPSIKALHDGSGSCSLKYLDRHMASSMQRQSNAENSKSKMPLTTPLPSSDPTTRTLS